MKTRGFYSYKIPFIIKKRSNAAKSFDSFNQFNKESRYFQIII